MNVSKSKKSRKLTKRRIVELPPRNGMELAGFLYSDAKRNAIACIEEIARRFQIDVEIK